MVSEVKSTASINTKGQLGNSQDIIVEKPGILKLTVVEARLTRDTDTFNKMDPYCII